MEVSKPVMEFAKRMQMKLDKNKNKECSTMNPDGKGRHWSKASFEWLLERCYEELEELEYAIKIKRAHEAMSTPVDVANMASEAMDEAADVGNFVMMIHDNLNGGKK